MGGWCTKMDILLHHKHNHIQVSNASATVMLNFDVLGAYQCDSTIRVSLMAFFNPFLTAWLVLQFGMLLTKSFIPIYELSVQRAGLTCTWTVLGSTTGRYSNPWLKCSDVNGNLSCWKL